MHVAYTKGLHELGDGLYAYLQPDGGWGWSNAGLVTAGGTSLLIDTLYDLRLTREMLDAMAPVTADHPIDAAMNTHANPDHCFGNELLPRSTEIYSSQATADEMGELSPQQLHAIKAAEAAPARAGVRRHGVRSVRGGRHHGAPPVADLQWPAGPRGRRPRP